MKIIIAPDKFKGSLDSFALCTAIEKGILHQYPSATIHAFPMADGGDGFAAVMKHYHKMETVSSNTVDPLGTHLHATWQWEPVSKTAVIEVAAASGLVLLHKKDRNPLKTSTYGTGLLIQEAINKGASKIILGLGGSATNDGGTGILQALGFVFATEDGMPFQPTGGNLQNIAAITPPPSLPAISIEIACDVENKLLGKQGAAYIYGPQKGATKEQVEFLDQGLQHLAKILHAQTGRDVSGIPGTGAAGGIAAGLMAFLPVTLKKGTEMLVHASGLEQHLKVSNLLITGEGKLDSQTAEGKVVGTMAALAKKAGVPCVAICGIVDLTGQELNNAGIGQAIAIHHQGQDISYSIKNAALLVEKAVRELVI